MTGAWITSQQAAPILGVSPKTVSRYAKEGKLPHQFTPGGHRRYLLADVERLAAGLRSADFTTPEEVPDGR